MAAYFKSTYHLSLVLKIFFKKGGKFCTPREAWTFGMERGKERTPFSKWGSGETVAVMGWIRERRGGLKISPLLPSLLS